MTTILIANLIRAFGCALLAALWAFTWRRSGRSLWVLALLVTVFTIGVFDRHEPRGTVLLLLAWLGIILGRQDDNWWKRRKQLALQKFSGLTEVMRASIQRQTSEAV